MSLWQHRGKDTAGSDTHMATNVHGTFLITDHPVTGIHLYRGVGLQKVLVSLGFRSVDAAKEYVATRVGA